MGSLICSILPGLPRCTVGSVVGWKRRESSSAACRRAVPSWGTAGSGNVHPGSLARCARQGFRSRGIRPLDPMRAAGHTEDEDRRRGNLRARTSMGDCAKPALRRKKVHHDDEPGHAHFLTFGRSKTHCLPACRPIRCRPDWRGKQLGEFRHAGKQWHTSLAPTTRGAGAPARIVTVWDLNERSTGGKPPSGTQRL